MTATDSEARMVADPTSPDREQDWSSAVDYAASYLRDVLRVDGARAEEDAEEQMRIHAKDMGIMLDSSPPRLPHSVPPSSPRLSRRSVSVYSITSQSTGITSIPSEASREQHRSRARLSIQDYDSFLARGTADEQRTALSFSTPSTPADSALSLPLCSPEPSPRRQSRVLKGLSILKLHRQDQAWRSAESCPHCPPGSMGQRRAVHKLPCGHKLCTQALRNTVGAAVQRQAGAVPCCCGRPIPGTLVQHVATHEEQEYLVEKLEQWDEAMSLASSIPSDEKELHASRAPPGGQPQYPRASADAPYVDRVDVDLAAIQERDDYKQLQQEQVELRDRTLRWTEEQRAGLVKNHERLRTETKARQETADENMMDAHERAMADAEDRQVKAESLLREAQAQERRDNATALRHLEAYCAGEYSTGEAHHRPVSAQARAELAKARRVQETMEPKHDSAINVLRGEQERRISLRHRRHERELQDLRRAHRKDELEFERSCTAEMQTFDDFVREKQQRLTAQWALQGAIFAKQVEIETGVKRDEQFFTTQWPTGELEHAVGV